MNGMAMQQRTDGAPPAPDLVVLSLALEQLMPCPTNPRKAFDEGRLDELAASIRTHGILQPLVVRRAKPNAHLTGGDFYEIVAGERRFRAAKRAKLTTVPAVLRELSDIQVLEAQLIENGQRDDIHPIEAADTFAALQKLDGSYNVKVIASKIGKSERYVQNVLHYAVLAPAVKKAFLENRINSGHADLIARLKADDQARALKACFGGLYGDDEDGALSVRQLDQWIKSNIRLEVTAKNPELAGLPSLEKAIAAAPDPAKLLQVHRDYGHPMKGALGPEAYKLVEKDRCAATERAVMVLGDRRGELVDICRARTTCKKHWRYEIEGAAPAKKASGTTPARKLSKWELQQQAKAKRGRRWGKIRKLAFAAVKAKAKGITLAQALPVLNYGINRWHATASKATLDQLVVAAVENDIRFIQQDTFSKHIAGPLKIDLKALEQQAFPPKGTKTAKHVAPKKPAPQLSRKQALIIHRLHAKTKKRKAGAKK